MYLQFFTFYLIIFLNFQNIFSKRIPQWWLDVAQKQGENVCAVEEIIAKNVDIRTGCKYLTGRNFCGEKTRIKFECCEGYDIIEEEKGCKKVKPLKSILDTIDLLGATKFGAYLRQSDLRLLLQNGSPYTVFVPTDEAMRKFETLTGPLHQKSAQERLNILKYHVVENRLNIDDLDADDLVDTLLDGYQIRVNKHDNTLASINCNLVLKKNEHSYNGISHLIDAVLVPDPAVQKQLVENINKDDRLTEFSNLIRQSNFEKYLENIKVPFTLFAPTNEAFSKLPIKTHDAIFRDVDLMNVVLKNHLVPKYICQSPITGLNALKTAAKNTLGLKCDRLSTYVNGALLQPGSITSKNAVVHVIDRVLLPQEAKSPLEVLEEKGLRTFVEFAKKVGMEEKLSGESKVTVFVPNEKAWSELMETQQSKFANNDWLRSLVMYHISPGLHSTKHTKDQKALFTMDGKNKPRFQVWRNGFGLEEARILESDVVSRNALLHVIDTVLRPSTKNLRQVLYEIGGHTFHSFLDVLRRATSHDPFSFNFNADGELFYTFFVPTDEAFNSYNQTALSKMATDKSTLVNFLKRHVTSRMFPANSFDPGLTYGVESMQGELLVKKTARYFKVNGVNILSSHITTNGVVHVLERVLKPIDSKGQASFKSNGRGHFAAKTGQKISRPNGRRVVGTADTRGSPWNQSGRDFSETISPVPRSKAVLESVGQTGYQLPPGTSFSQFVNSSRNVGHFESRPGKFVKNATFIFNSTVLPHTYLDSRGLNSSRKVKYVLKGEHSHFYGDNNNNNNNPTAVIIIDLNNDTLEQNRAEFRGSKWNENGNFLESKGQTSENWHKFRPKTWNEYNSSSPLPAFRNYYSKWELENNNTSDVAAIIIIDVAKNATEIIPKENELKLSYRVWPNNANRNWLSFKTGEKSRRNADVLLKHNKDDSNKYQYFTNSVGKSLQKTRGNPHSKSLEKPRGITPENPHSKNLNFSKKSSFLSQKTNEPAFRNTTITHLKEYVSTKTASVKPSEINAILKELNKKVHKNRSNDKHQIKISKNNQFSDEEIKKLKKNWNKLHHNRQIKHNKNKMNDHEDFFNTAPYKPKRRRKGLHKRFHRKGLRRLRHSQKRRHEKHTKNKKHKISLLKDKSEKIEI